ncbi:MAG TPA: hypothetical protein VFO39_19650 [Candidatus Sulfotelmatobacter sp.]|nr:hypothetical protein [Candidatus Sulfotelmatobacter sp.]
MRLDINLASQPYQDARQFWMRWGSALVLLGLFTLILLGMTVAGYLNARRDHSEMSQLRGQIARCDQKRHSAEEFLNRNENRTTRDESQFLNELIQRKSFSWTRVLEDLEKVMPPRLHLVSIHPALDTDNQLSLKMVVAGDSRDHGIELTRRMEESQRFAQSHVSQERINASPVNGDNIVFDIDALYVPASVKNPAASAKPRDASDPETTTEVSKRNTP